MTSLSLWKRLRQSPKLGEDPIFYLLLRYSAPAILSYFISELYNIVDTLFVGQGIGSMAVGALGLCFPIQRLAIALTLLIAFSVQNRMAYALGEGKKEQASVISGCGFFLNVVILLPYSLLSFLGASTFMQQFSADLLLSDWATHYIHIVCWGSLFLGLQTLCSRILLVYGKPMLSIYLALIGALINALLDALFILVLKWGVMGAAWATLSSQIFSCLISMVVLLYFQKRGVVKKMGLPRRFRSLVYECSRILAEGLPSFVVESEDAIVLAILNGLFYQAGGAMAVSILSINTKIYMFLFVLILGIAYGMQTLIAFNEGARRLDRVQEILKKALVLSVLVTVLATAVFYIAAKGFAGFMVQDPLVQALSERTLRFMIYAFPLLGFYYCAVMTKQAQGKALLATVLTFLRQILLLCPLTYIAYAVWRWDWQHMFLVYPVTDVLAALVGLGVLWLLFQDLRKRRAGMIR